MVDLLGGLRGLQSGRVLLRHLPLLVPLLLRLQGGWLTRTGTPQPLLLPPLRLV